MFTEQRAAAEIRVLDVFYHDTQKIYNLPYKLENYKMFMCVCVREKPECRAIF